MGNILPVQIMLDKPLCLLYSVRTLNTEADMDTMYAERNWKGFSAWTYSDGLRYSLGSFRSVGKLEKWAKAKHYKVVWVK
jgi:hypothetical protein